jgi:hypothetical protein
MDSLPVAAGLQRAYHTRFTILSLCLSRQLRSDCDHDLADGPLGLDQFVRLFHRRDVEPVGPLRNDRMNPPRKDFRRGRVENCPLAADVSAGEDLAGCPSSAVA